MTKKRSNQQNSTTSHKRIIIELPNKTDIINTNQMANTTDIAIIERHDYIKNSEPSKTETTNNTKMDTLNTNIVIDKPNLYNRTDQGPYKVIITKEKLNMLSPGKALSLNKLNNIDSVTQISKNMARVTFKNHMDANNCIKSEFLRKTDGYSAFIPNNFNNSIGVIKNVPIEIDEKELAENIRSNIDISKIERMTKWNPTTKQPEKMELVKLHFKSHT